MRHRIVWWPGMGDRDGYIHDERAERAIEEREFAAPANPSCTAREGIGWPRIERNHDGECIINQGPRSMASVVSMMYSWLPKQWPADWPESGVIDAEDPRVLRYLWADLP